MLEFVRQTSIVAMVCYRFYRLSDVTRFKSFSSATRVLPLVYILCVWVTPSSRVTGSEIEDDDEPDEDGGDAIDYIDAEDGGAASKSVGVSHKCVPLEASKRLSHEQQLIC